VTSLARELHLSGHGPLPGGQEASLKAASDAVEHGDTQTAGKRWHKPVPGLDMEDTSLKFARLFAYELQLQTLTHVPQEELFSKLLHKAGNIYPP